MDDIKSKCSAVIHQLQGKYEEIEAPLKTAWAELVALTMKCKLLEEETQGKLNEFTKNNRAEVVRAYTMLVLTQLIELVGSDKNFDKSYVLIPFEDEVNSILSSIVVPPHNSSIDLDPDIVTFIKEHIKLEYSDNYLTTIYKKKELDDSFDDWTSTDMDNVAYHEGNTNSDVDYEEIKPHLCTYAEWANDLECRRDQMWAEK